jgi:uncharacterized protein with HEPN domain
MKRDVVFLRHILDAIELVKEYTASGKNAFMSSSLHQDGVIRQLEIVV